MPDWRRGLRTPNCNVRVNQETDTTKYLPVVRANTGVKKVPTFLGSRFYADFSDDSNYQAALDALIREIHGTPSLAKPPLGPNPFAGALDAGAGPQGPADPSVPSAAGAKILDNSWFLQHRNVAEAGLGKSGAKSSTELRFAPHHPVRRSQIELLNAVRNSEIKTFGWPIGIVLDNRDDLKPRPTADGIVAEVRVDPMWGESDKPTYDYWALRSSGEFYLLQSLFEDQRDKDKIFFDTRIVRVTEALIFCANLYSNLNVENDSRLEIRVSHRGLANRLLTSASPHRHIWSAASREDASEYSLQASISDLRQQLTERVRQILEPMFALFDFKQFSQDVYDDIIKKFIAGKN